MQTTDRNALKIQGKGEWQAVPLAVSLLNKHRQRTGDRGNDLFLQGSKQDSVVHMRPEQAGKDCYCFEIPHVNAPQTPCPFLFLFFASLPQAPKG